MVPVMDKKMKADMKPDKKEKKLFSCFTKNPCPNCHKNIHLSDDDIKRLKLLYRLRRKWHLRHAQDMGSIDGTEIISFPIIGNSSPDLIRSQKLLLSAT
jgi:hypothetical protein